MQRWLTDVAVPVGDRFLCFVDYMRGFLLCDMADADDVAALELRHVALPVKPPVSFDDDGERPTTQMFRNIAAASATAVRFVTVDRRCCCGGLGVSTCERGQFLFKVTMWTLSLTTTVATWVKDGELDCEELWAMPGYHGSLPRTEWPTLPVVSCDDPDVVRFVLHNAYGYNGEDRKVWVLEIDMRKKALRSVVLHSNADEQVEFHVAAQLLF
ncbi:hypothetical protein HU200_029111 [Digitaria exilis]|uniref:DUF1618 domain-containing protein n=1 Tax=Digitaria exilis TaxID=1010633 RepID=A0A835ET31_9POAL|nr:hypothetical protein HU200_029111 [Digitaria exilis]CAB3489280.1 unnamed protein product [Digitaria exilis]